MDALRHRTPFEQLPPARGSLSGSLGSIILHAGMLLFLVFGLQHTPRLTPSSTRAHQAVRLMNLRPPVPEEHSSITLADATSPSPEPPAPTVHFKAAAVPPTLFAPRIRGTQTLLQPDAPPDVILPRSTPIPFVMVWSAQVIPIKPTVSTSPEQTLVANEHPSQTSPNQELAQAEIKIAATPFHTATPMPAPSTVSPIIAIKPEAPPTVPLTVSNAIGKPAPARIMSLSDLELKDGTVAIPLANSSAAAAPTDSTSLVRAKGFPTPVESGVGSGTAAKPSNINGATPRESASKDTHPSLPVINGGSNPSQAPGPITSRADERNIVRVHRPRDGQFGVVVVGSALTEDYPEAKELWGGRLVYTVYLHIGTGKNWILQYSLPRSAETASSGSATRPEPPWPYELARPAPSAEDLDADTVMIHGYVTVDGRFDKTSVIFPAAIPHAKALLDDLDLWLFRPAHQNGQPTSVEVLLIIPAEGA